MQLIDTILASQAEITAIRRDLHRHPELCFQEQRTADVIAKALTDWGIPVHRGLGTTGVVGIVKAGSSPRAIGLRADIDALPMTERNSFPHASTFAGRMHACGHDGHTAMLLAAAKHLATQRHFDGTVYLVFQPAEEGGGGARGDDQGRPFREVSDGGHVRRPQLARPQSGQFALNRAPCSPPATSSASCSRAGAATPPCRIWGSIPCRRPASSCRLSNHRQPQQAAAGSGRHLRHHDPRWRSHQCGARQCRAPGHRAHLHHRAARPLRTPHARDDRGPGGRLRADGRVPLSPQLPAHHQPRRRDRLCARRAGGHGWGRRTSSSSSPPWAPKTSATTCCKSPAATS